MNVYDQVGRTVLTPRGTGRLERVQARNDGAWAHVKLRDGGTWEGYACRIAFGDEHARR